MAAPTWYNPTDQAIFKDNQFITQQPYRLGPYKAPTTEEQITTSGVGIPYTGAFTNSGGGGGGTGGNAFGYGTAIDPIAHGAYGEPGYSGGLAGNVQQTGWGRQEDPEGGAYLRPRKELPGIASMALGVLPFGNLLRRKIEDKMNPVYDSTKDLGGYKVGGMDYNQTGLYNSLANEGMLFEGPGGVKTLTGKNFTGKGYLEGQLELAKGFGFENMTDAQIQEALEEEGQRHLGLGHTGKGFKYKQMLEAKAIYDKNKESQDRDWAAEHAAKKEADQAAADQAAKTTGPVTGQGGQIADKDVKDIGGGFHEYKDPGIAASYEGSFAQGGRIGFQGGGGPAGGASAGGDYGGNVNPEQEYAGRTFQDTYGGDGNNQGNTGGITQLNTDLISTSPSAEINYDFKKLPLYLQAKLHNKNLLTEDDINLEGQVGGSAGLVDYGMNFTGEGATGSYIGMGPVNVDIDPHKNIRNISFDQDIGNWNVQGNTDLENYSGAVNYQPNDWLTLGGSMDNTGQRNVGFEISKKWGQPEHTYSTQALLKENPNLIYGMEGQNLRYGGLAGLL